MAQIRLHARLIFMFGLNSLSRWVRPIRVPVVPMVATTMVTLPPVCSQISRPVPW